jgi:hypothetical protein
MSTLRSSGSAGRPVIARELVAGNDPARLAREFPQKRKLRTGQLDLLAFAVSALVGAEIDRELSKAQP